MKNELTRFNDDFMGYDFFDEAMRDPRIARASSFPRVYAYRCKGNE